MGIRRLHCVVWVVLLFSLTAPGRAQQQLSDPPRVLAYAAPLLRGAYQSAIKVGPSGRIYTTGFICEGSLPVTAAAIQSTYRGTCDGYVAILGPDRRLEYATYLGGTGQDRAWGIDVDAAGNVYVVGDTGSPDFPTTAGAPDTTVESGDLDGFVVKLSPSGALIYSTLLGGDSYEFALGVTPDATGVAHVVGYTNGADFPTTPGALSRGHHGGSDAFYARIGSAGTALAYSTYIGGSGSENARWAHVDATGAVYVGGETESGDLPVIRAAQPAPGGGTDGWILKFAPAGAVDYLTYFGGSGHDPVVDMVVRGGSVFLAGNTCSADLPGAPARPATCTAAYIADFAADGSSWRRSMVIEDLQVRAADVDARQRAYLVGYSSPPFALTPDAFQTTRDWAGSPALAVLPLDAATPTVQYASYAGNGGPLVNTAQSDGNGGVFIGGQLGGADTQTTLPVVNAPFWSVPAGGLVMHFVPERAITEHVPREIVMYAADVRTIRGNWRIDEDPSAALGRKLRNPNGGEAKLNAALAAPADYVEFQFEAEAGVGYHLWLRGRADADNWANDSVFVQFSDAVDASGAPVARIGTTGGMSVNLEDCTNCGVKGWGWQDNGYGAGVLGPAVRFAASGTHTLRVQRREDGYAFDQIVLSAARFATAAPGPLKQATTVLPRSNGNPAAGDVVLHMTGAQPHGTWNLQPRSGAASGLVARTPDTGGAKVVTMPVPAVNYVELTFTAEAGRPYRLWVRGLADRDYWGNDSVHVQFSDSVDAGGAARWRIGTASSTEVNLEDCSGCGIRGWGWQDNGWGVGVSGPAVYFASSGSHTIRLTTREDGFSIDQIVLSPDRYLTSSPGALKNDTTILPKSQ